MPLFALAYVPSAATRSTNYQGTNQVHSENTVGREQLHWLWIRYKQKDKPRGKADSLVEKLQVILMQKQHITRSLQTYCYTWLAVIQIGSQLINVFNARFGAFESVVRA